MKNQKNKQKLVEVARSFSYKLNLGNYQTADFFCSEKAEVPESEVEETSEKLFAFCRREVEKSVETYQRHKSQKTLKPSERQQAKEKIAEEDGAQLAEEEMKERVNNEMQAIYEEQQNQ